MVAALHSYTHLTWLRFGGSGSLVVWIQNDVIMMRMPEKNQIQSKGDMNP
jgi:hypothetical protein